MCRWSVQRRDMSICFQCLAGQGWHRPSPSLNTGERKALRPGLPDQTRPAGVSTALTTEETPTECFVAAKELKMGVS